MKRLLILFSFIPILCRAQTIPHSQAQSTYFQSNVGVYKQAAIDSVFTFQTGRITLTATTITVDGIVYQITATDTEFCDASNDFWKTETLNGTIAAVIHRNSNYTLASVFIGNKSYYFY